MKARLVIISSLAVALSCALLISLASVFSGFIEAVEGGASSSMGDVIIRPHPSLKIEQYDRLTAEIDKLERVEGSSALLSTHGLMLLGKGNVRKVDIWGIDLEKQNLITQIKDQLITDGEPFGAGSAITAIGVLQTPDPLTDDYNLTEAQGKIGMPALLLAAKPAGEDVATQRIDMRVRIANVSFSGINQFDSSNVYVPLETLSASLYPDEPLVADTVQVRLKAGLTPEQEHQSLREIDGVWRKFAAETLQWPASWINAGSVALAKELQRQMVVEYQKQLDVLMAIFSIVSAGIILLVFCIFYMIVLGRRKDIAIIRSCGHSACSVAGMFIWFGMLAAIAGIALGIGLGALFTHNINGIEDALSKLTGVKVWKASVYMFSEIPNHIDAIATVKISLYAFIASLIGSAIPAIIAAKTDPVKTLRYE
ncbi:MAG: FtsX-like permease family protein [Phycisphaerae bacterium]